MAKKRKQKLLFPELDDIVAALQSDERQDLIILIVPSHDKSEVELPDQDVWAASALDLLGDLYGGATAFKTFAGVYKSHDGQLLHDKPILIESYACRSEVEDEMKLKQLLAFAKRMGKETDQESVGIVINSVFHNITEY